MRLPIRIDLPDGKSKGTTRDLSSSGVFIHADPSLRIGARVRFNITLPHELLGVPRDVQVICAGRVVRVERERGAGKGRAGVACVIDTYRFARRNAARRGA